MALSKNPHFSWNQAKEMQDSGVIDIQSHTHSHQVLTGLMDFDLYFELKTSKNLIENKLGKKCSVLSFPQGIADEREVQAAKDAGYLIANKVGDVGVNRKSEGLYELKRITAPGRLYRGEAAQRSGRKYGILKILRILRSIFCLSQYTQMLEQNFQPHQNQNHTAEQLGPGFVLCAEHVADLDAHSRQDKGGYADQRHGGNDLHL